MSQQLINHSPDLKRLRDEGYDINIKAGHLIVKGVPYVTPGKVVAYGTLVTPLSLAGNITIKPATHVAYFIGEHPCNKDGSPMTRLVLNSVQQQLAEAITVQHTFSSKPFPPEAGYPNYYELITSYANIISNAAQAINSAVTAKSFPVIEPSEDDSVFCYVDTASSRTGIAAVSSKLALSKVAIVGLGGTGTYVLDFLAKTPVKEIHIFDGDVFSQHNAFRSPGAPSLEALKSKPKKVHYFFGIYSNMHRHIIPHDYYVDESNVNELECMDFVFLCLDRGDVKQKIIAALEAAAIAFIDVGMGIYVQEESLQLGGIVRVTTSTNQQRAHVHDKKRISFGNGAENEYQQNIQIADLNALNAALAVGKWKKHCKFYLDLEREYHSTYTIDGNILLNEDQKHEENADHKP